MLVRALIVLLACMNLGVALWWALHRDPPPPPLPPLDPGVGSLVLARERPATPVVDAAELSADPEPLPAGSTCMSLGPFEDAAVLRNAMNTLLPLAERIQFREVAATVLRGYRVLLPPAASRTDAQVIARAATGGIDDYYDTACAEQNSIALGTYKDLPNATKRRDAIAALEATHRSSSRAWNRRRSGGSTWPRVPAWIRAWPCPAPALTVQPVACQ